MGGPEIRTGFFQEKCNGKIHQKKGINDLQNFAVPNKVDYIAASFVQCAADIAFIRSTLGEGGKHIKIISKIENQAKPLPASNCCHAFSPRMQWSLLPPPHQ